ncbi:histone acetyltransferase KAT6A-like isoform X2 [Spodoptera litura]|uniref:Histone acetyltransferase KAT6A-like isoform X2 n=1 Tax=Spodoptera litura TaxID=69820 RepID=A0A9J7E608_SPOLT|nr:histone acetyltransferase KAT6A-like isoform X2 [Spodoptera litura]
MHTLILAALAAVTTAMPSYIAVPADQIAFVDLTALRVRRMPRQTLSPPPPPPQIPLPQLPQAFYEQEYPTTLQQYQQQRLTPVPVPVQVQVQENEAPARLVRLQQQPQQQPQPQDSIGSTTFGAASQFAERPPDFGEYVDFGAHTGDHGSFGWYADYPVNNHQDSSYRK